MAEKESDSTTREQALRVARMLGCQGAHEHPNGWMPCASHEEYEAIKKGKEEYLKVLASKKKKPLPKIVQRTKRLETKSDAYYENRADALSISKIRGCGGVRTVILAGKRYYTPCNHKPNKGWEKLDESPITGIATLPGGGLVTGSFSGKSVEDDVEEKGFVNFVSRSTDPDTFSDPESARIRARNLGCIGIRRYTARDGKLVWMPCTNVSDYNRVTGIRGDNSPRNNPRRQGSGFKKKALGTPIGAKPSGENVDGDGDGFTTGGIVGGEDKIPVAPKIIKKKFKNPTQVGIARALNDANHRKAGYRGGTMVRGYGSTTAGWRSRKLENGDFEIEHTVPMGVYRDVGLIGLSDDQRKANFEKATRMLQTTLENYAKTLKDKGYEVIITTSTNKKGELSGFVVVKNQEKKSLNQSAEKLGVGLVLFKGVPKARKKPPTVTSTDINNLAIRVRQHNAKAKPAQRANLRDLKNVYLRGLEDGDKTSANKRVSKFLSLLMSDKPKDVKYFDDNDLLPLNHPWRNRKTTKKWAGFDDGEYGVKYAEKCCPQVVKRYRAK